MPVSASGDSDARSSIAMRSSSSKSMSSAAIVAMPISSASSDGIGPSLPRARTFWARPGSPAGSW